MARRRLNTKFLVIAAVPVVLLVGAAAAYKILPRWFPQVKWIVRGTPASHAAAGKALFDQGQYAEAGEKYKRAIQLKGAPDAEMYTALGDCYTHLVLEDQENMRLAVACWDQALIVNPQHLPALQRKFDLVVDDAEANRGNRSAQAWDEVRTAALKVLAVDPQHHRARVEQHRATIQRWMAGVETDQKRVDDAVAGLLAISQEQPFDADTVFYVMQAKVQRAQELVRQNDRASANAIFAEVLKLVDDSLAAHPDDALMHFRAGQALRFLGATERAPGQPPKYTDRMQAELEKAVALVKPEHPLYAEMRLFLGKQHEMAAKPDEAEKLYRAVLSERPGEIIARIMLAELIGRIPARRDEAAKLLEEIPAPDQSKIYGFQALMRRQYEQAALATLLSIKLDALANIKDPQEHEATLKQIEDGYAKLVSAPGYADSPMTLMIRGQLELARNQNVQAVQTLDRARNMMSRPSSMAEVNQYYELLFTLSRAYVLTEQTGAAKELLTVIVRDFEKYLPARLMLVQLLLREKNIEEAAKHLKVLEQEAPDSPIVTRLAMFSLDKEKDKARLAELYKKLPESTGPEALDKAQMAIYCENRQDAARLFQAVYDQNPKSLDILAALARVYVDLGQKDRATQIVDAALAADPERAALKMLRAQIAGEDTGELRRDLIEKIADPFDKEMALFELSAQEEKETEALQHLLAAEKLKPDDNRVQLRLFRLAMAQRDWDKATAYLEKLAKKNDDLAGGMLYRIELAMARGELDQAFDQAQQLTGKLPEFALSWVMLGKVQQAQGRYSDAIVNYTAALGKQAQNLDAIRGLIDCSYALNQPAAARRYIDQGRKVFPGNAALRELDLEHELAYGDKEKVIAPRQEMVKSDPEQPRAWYALGNTYLAIAKSKENDQAARPFYDKARETFAQAMAKWPTDARFVQLYAQTSLTLKNVADGEKAILALRDREEWKGRPEPTLLLADYYASAGKRAEQEKLLREYLAASPTAIPVQQRLAALLASQNKLDEALKLLEPNASDPAIQKQRIELQINGNRLADAEKEIQQILAATATPSPTLLVRQAYVYLSSGRPTEALRVLDKILSSPEGKGNPEALYNRATIYVTSRSNLDQAIRDLQAVRGSGFSQVDAQMLLSAAYQCKDDDDSAIRELESLVRDFPNEKVPRLRLLALYSDTGNLSTMPRWSQAERLVRDTRANPQLANDPDMLHAEARMWLAKKETSKALEVVQAALKAAPNNLEIFRTLLAITLESKQYRPLLQVTDPIVQGKQAPWWVYDYRGRAKKALDDKQGALDEFSAGIDLAAAQQNDEATAQIVDTIASEIGVGPAKIRVLGRAEKGEFRWQMMMAYLCQADNDVTGAIGWVEKALEASSLSAGELDLARSRAGTLYLLLDPPQTEKAITVFRKLLETRPNDPTVLNNLACTMILPNSGYTAKDALQYSQRAFDIFERQGRVEPAIHDTQGYVLVLLGRVDEGISLLRAAIEANNRDMQRDKAVPPLIEAYYHLGEAYLALPSPLQTDAEQVLKQAQTLIESAARDNKAGVDPALKTKVDKALERARQVAVAPRS